MQLERITPKLSTDLLYELFSQEEIMSFYFGESISFQRKFRNPFRPDVAPDCKFRYTQAGKLFFYDWATTKVYFSPIDIASLRTGIPYPEVLNKIYQDFTHSGSLQDIKYSLSTNKKEVVIAPADIRVKTIPFSIRDYEYWGQFGITPEILNTYDVKKCSKVWINGSIWKVSKENNPVYRYREKDKFKIYCPFEKKENKFRNNLFGGILEGYLQLPEEGELLFITKSRKDAMTLYSLDYPAVGVRSEGTPISENALKILKKRFKNIVIWFDNDLPGVSHAEKLSQKTNLPFIYLPEHFAKDPSDCVKAMGKNVLKLWIEETLCELKM